MLPDGRRSDAFFAPLKIWSNTGTDGDWKETPLMVKFPESYSLDVRKQASENTKEAFTHKSECKVDVDVSTAWGSVAGLHRVTRSSRQD
jgi:hypothetical protein